MSNTNTRQTHPLIPSDQTYFLERKIVSIHSYDRDFKKYPYANHFEVILPESLLNVQSIRLATISLPSNQYVFSNEYQNTKLSFSLKGWRNNGKIETDPCELAYSQPYIFTATIKEGTYSPCQLAIEVCTQMNMTVWDDPIWKAVWGSDSTLAALVNFVCKYNEVSNTFWFGNNSSYPTQALPPGVPSNYLSETFVGHFTLHFGRKEEYSDICPGQVNVWPHYARWGLPAYLGYQKFSYNSTRPPRFPIGFTYEYPKHWLTSKYATWVDVCDPSGIYPPICNLDIMGDDVIYMELDRYNTIDELEPYSENTSGWYNNDYGGKVKSAFAKIAVPCTPYAQVFDSMNAFIMNISSYQPPIERLVKCRFKFRYHDGRLVDFKCLPLSFSLEFNMLRPEQFRGAMVRKNNTTSLQPPFWEVTR